MVVTPRSLCLYGNGRNSRMNGTEVSSDHLVCHRVKECCVHLHSCIQKWEELSTASFDVASKLVNTSLESKYAHEKDAFGELKKFPALSVALEGKAIAERESLFTRLKETITELSKVVEQMGVLSSNLRAVSELAMSRGQDPELPLFQTLPTTMFGTYAEEIFTVYSQEMSLRESILGDILQQKERDTLTVYLSCWLHQPYISTESSDHLEAMLIECGLRQ